MLACASSAFPHYYGYLKTPPGYQFLWSGYPWDANQYYSWMYLGYRGDWLFTNLLTPESHPPVILMPFFVLLGHLARIWGGALALLKGSAPSSAHAIPATFHLARTFLAFFLVYWIDRAARSCRLTGFQRIWIAAFAIFAGGAWPRSTNLAETHVWLSIAQFPNFSASLIAYLGVCAAFARSLEEDMRPGAESRRCGDAGNAPAGRAWRTQRLRHPLEAGFWGFILAWIHYFDLPALGLASIFAGAGCWRLTRRPPRRMLFTFAGFSLGSLIPVIYQWSILRDVPMFQAIQESNRMEWKWQGEGFAMLDVFFILGIGGLPFLWRKRRRPGALWIGCWLSSAALVCLLPFSFQRRVIEGLPLALAFALPFCIEGWLIHPWLRWRIKASRRPRRQSLILMRRLACWGFLLLLLPRTLFIMNDHSFILYRALKDLYYLHQEEIEAAEWLRNHSKGSEIVWASEVRGNRISFITGLRVFFGHDVLTVDSGRKKIWCRDLFNYSMPAAEFRAIVENYHVRYIFWTEHERRRDPRRRDFREFDPEAIDPPVFQNSFVKIYPIRPSLFLR